MKNSEFVQKFNKWNENPTIPFENSLQKNTFKSIYPNGFPVHPLTCGNNSNHANLIAVEINNNIKLKCKDCEYVQDFVPSWLFDKVNHISIN